MDAWVRLVGELGGEIEFDKRGKPSRVLIPHRAWRIVLDVHTASTGTATVIYNRVRALFERGRPFELRVTERNFIHALARWIGRGGVDMGYGRFDRALFVQSPQPDTARAVLRGTSLGQALISKPPVKLAVTRPGRRIRKAVGDTVGEVQILRHGELRDVADLREMVQMAMWTLDELARAGAATEEAVSGAAL